MVGGVASLTTAMRYQQMQQQTAMRTTRMAMEQAMNAQAAAMKQQQTAMQTIQSTAHHGETLGRMFSVLSPTMTSYMDPHRGQHVDLLA